MKNILILLFLCLISSFSLAQDLRCFTLGTAANTTTISVLTACSKHLSRSVNGATSYVKSYNCVSGDQWVGGETIFYFDCVVEGRYTFKIKGFATDLDMFILSACDETMCLSSEGARRR